MVRLLVIDDDPDIRESIAEILSLEGFEVATAADGCEGLEKARAEDPFAAIVLDMMMPRLNGWQFRAAQKRDPRLSKVPVIAVTATAGLHEIDADRVLAKPFEIPALLHAVRSALRRSEA